MEPSTLNHNYKHIQWYVFLKLTCTCGCSILIISAGRCIGLSRASIPPQDLERKLLYEEMYNLRRERDEAMKERDEAIWEFKTLKFSVNTVRENDTKCKLMTGLSWTVFDTLHQCPVQFVKPQKTSKLLTQDQLFITLVKLRQNPSTDLMCGIFDLAHSTCLDAFSRWLDLMYAKTYFLNGLIESVSEAQYQQRFSSSTLEWLQLSTALRSELNTQRSWKQGEIFFFLIACIKCPVFVIITWLSVYMYTIYRSVLLKTLSSHRAITYSKYKNWTTVKYFIACQPSGSITYLSKGWGGRASDVHIVRNSDFLSQKFFFLIKVLFVNLLFTHTYHFWVAGEVK